MFLSRTAIRFDHVTLNPDPTVVGSETIGKREQFVNLRE